MVNDLNTLSGALVECKDQLISELANQGVTTTYDPTTGLLGLIHKISEITPTTPSLTLTTNKNILSYYDSETATLTATHSQGAGKTVEIYNATTGTKIGDATDNLDGTYSYTYHSTSIGDISMTATAGTTESNSILIEDCLYFDAQTTDKQRYTVTSGGANISYSSDGVTIAGTQATDCLVKNTALSLPNSYSAEVTLTKLSGYIGAGKIQYGGLCFDNCLIDMSSSSIDIYTLSPIASLTTINQGASQRDVLKIEMDNGTMKIYINDILKTTQTISHTGIHQHRSYKLDNQNPKSITAKDLKIKPLPTQ